MFWSIITRKMPNKCTEVKTFSYGNVFLGSVQLQAVLINLVKEHTVRYEKNIHQHHSNLTETLK